MVSIRRATPEDAPHVADLISELGYTQPAEFYRERLALFEQMPDELVLVAEQQGKVIGVLVFTAFYYFHQPGKQGRIIALVVTEMLRNQGTGQVLVEAAESYAVERGCTRMEVTTGVQREKAHRFYESMGYRETSKRYLKPLESQKEA